MKSSTMVESGTPAACICAILSLAGWEKLQPSMLQLATVSGQPHWQASRAPTRRIFWVVLAICAHAAGISARVSNIRVGILARNVAHALVRAASRLFSTPVRELAPYPGIEKRLD